MTLQKRVRAGMSKPRSLSPLGTTAPSGKVSYDQSLLSVDPATHGERLMTLAEVAEMLSIPLETLYAWRHRGLGPSGYRVGRYVRYRRSAVESWLETQADDRC